MSGSIGVMKAAAEALNLSRQKSPRTKFLAANQTTQERQKLHRDLVA